MRIRTLALLSLVAWPLWGHPARRGVDQDPTPLIPYKTYPDRAAAIRAAFVHSWKGYREYAFPRDTLRPLSNSGYNDRNLLYGCVADPAGYDLLKGPFSFRGYPTDQIDALLRQASELGFNLVIAFDTPSGVPDNEVLFLDPLPRMSGAQQNGLAAIGTLVLEWTRLGDLTNQCVFGDLVHRAQNYLLYPSAQDEVWPGLLGNQVSLENGSFIDRTGGWGAETDSFYEYLLKMYIYDPVRFEDYKARWIAAADSTIEHLISRVEGRPSTEWAFLSSYSYGVPRHSSGHLACFAGGNFVLGGLTLSEQKYIDAGLAITDGCRQVYSQTATGIGPEFFEWQGVSADGGGSGNKAPQEQSKFADKAGFWITSGQYILRPEVIESYYYAYRATGNPKYQEWAWEAFEAINRTCSAGSGYAGISDVNDVAGASFHDSQESFWLAETIKYSYLIQADDWFEVQVQADKHNSSRWIYNTEGHPVRSPCKHDGEGFVCEPTCQRFF